MRRPRHITPGGRESERERRWKWRILTWLFGPGRHCSSTSSFYTASLCSCDLMIPSRPCVATNSEIGAGEEDEIERRSFARPTQLSRSSKTPTFAPQAIDPVVGPCPQVCLHSFLLPRSYCDALICSCFFCYGARLDFRLIAQGCICSAWILGSIWITPFLLCFS